MPDDPLTIPVILGRGANEMAEPTPAFASLHDQNMAGMGQAMTRFQGDQVTISKASDYSFLQGKDLISLTEAVGVREIASENNPAGPSKP